MSVKVKADSRLLGWVFSPGSRRLAVRDLTNIAVWDLCPPGKQALQIAFNADFETTVKYSLGGVGIFASRYA